jgi:hypothetical protein
MAGVKAAEGPGGAHDGQRTLVEHARARGPHDLGLDQAAGSVDGDVHRQLAVQLAALIFGEVACAALLDALLEGVVIERVDLLLRGRADVALLRARIFVVDALLDLGQQAQQLALAFLLVAVVGPSGLALCVGGGQQGQLASHLGQQLLLLLLQLFDLAPRSSGRRRVRPPHAQAVVTAPAPSRHCRRRPDWPGRWPAPWSAVRSSGR